MLISIITLFPDMFDGLLRTSIVKRAIEKNILQVSCINLRDYATDAYKSVDDHPYGGGVGMVLRVDVVDRAIKSVKAKSKMKPYTVLLDPQGIPYTQKQARTLSTKNHLILVCGHYEGVDERIRALVDEEISIGDYVLTGGELPAMVLTDSVARLLPGTLSNDAATRDESFESGLLEHPQYTRPETYTTLTVPPVLLSGNHKKIQDWRKEQSLKRTAARRPDLLMSRDKT